MRHSKLCNPESITIQMFFSNPVKRDRKFVVVVVLRNFASIQFNREVFFSTSADRDLELHSLRFSHVAHAADVVSLQL